MLLTFSSMVRTVMSVSPVTRNCSPLNSSMFRLSGKCTSVISGNTGREKRSFSVSPSGFSSGCGFSIFGSTTSSCATSATFGRAISRPFSDVGFRVRVFSCQFRPEVKSITDTVVSSILMLTLSSATRVRVMGYGVERSSGPLSSSSSTCSEGGIFLLSILTWMSFSARSLIQTLLFHRHSSPTARCRLPAFTATPGCS